MRQSISTLPLDQREMAGNDSENYATPNVFSVPFLRIPNSGACRRCLTVGGFVFQLLNLAERAIYVFNIRSVVRRLRRAVQ